MTCMNTTDCHVGVCTDVGGDTKMCAKAPDLEKNYCKWGEDGLAYCNSLQPGAECMRGHYLDGAAVKK
jgi:hypothetical protein